MPAVMCRRGTSGYVNYAISRTMHLHAQSGSRGSVLMECLSFQCRCRDSAIQQGAQFTGARSGEPTDASSDAMWPQVFSLFRSSSIPYSAWGVRSPFDAVVLCTHHEAACNSNMKRSSPARPTQLPAAHSVISSTRTKISTAAPRRFYRPNLRCL